MSSGSVFAQYSDYDYYGESDDYDDYQYENNYGSSQGKNEYQQYRKSRREEDLYNRRSTYEEQSGGTPNYFISGPRNRDRNNTGNNNTYNRPWQSGNKPSDKLDSDPANDKNVDHSAADVLAGKDKDQGKEPKPGDEEGGKDHEVPPPPDEPDVPVDSAIPFLIVSGIAIASYRFYIKKRVLAS